VGEQSSRGLAHGYDNVWIGSRISDEVIARNALSELRQIPAQLRFLVISRLYFDPGELDLSGIGWHIADIEAVGPRNVEGARSIQLQALRSGTPLWHESAPRSSFFGSRRAHERASNSLRGP
jgi:protein gp37